MSARDIVQAAAGASGPATYVEDVFSTYLYTGDDTNSRVITNNIDLAGSGGMVITAPRSNGNFWSVADSARGATKWLYTQSTGAQQTGTDRYGSFDATGYTMGSSAANGYMNFVGYTYASWTFRKQPKFFDVVTWTGTGSTRSIAHSLGSVPGCIIIKCTSNAEDWFVYHASLGNTGTNQYFCILNSTAAVDTGGYGVEKASNWTSTQFGINGSPVNVTGQTYVAYIFAHNAGGFGLTGTDNVISCGSYAGTGVAGNLITLGFEPQWVMIKRVDSSTQNWNMFDNMRGFVSKPTSGSTGALYANQSIAESTGTDDPYITSTGFGLAGSNAGFNASGGTYIYIAIRRGPMKVPTVGTSVFSPILSSASGGTDLITNFPVDLQIASRTGGTVSTTKNLFFDRLRGVSTTATGSGQRLMSHSTSAELAVSNATLNWGNTGFQMPGLLGTASTIFWNLKRAPGFFDEVCYTGTGVANDVAHNLGVVPELLIIKSRTGLENWPVWSKYENQSIYYCAYLNSTGSYQLQSAFWGNTGNANMTSATFSLGTAVAVNGSANTFVAYLFASCPGVSKVGSYTGNGSSQTINCGFSGGARFILIKRTNTTGDWYVWDTARGIFIATDPHLSLNTTAAEVSTDDSIDADASGFIVNQLVSTNINVTSATYIYLAIA
jgi:hypothetical protein